MTPTPPLTRRVVRRGVIVAAIMLVVVNAVVFLLLSQRLYSSVDDLLAERAALVRTQADIVREAGGGPADLAVDLQARGLRVLIRTPRGETFTADPMSPVVGGRLSSTGSDVGPGRTLVVRLDNGVRAVVFASTSGVTATLRQFVVLQIVASAVALALAALMLERAARQALAPVADIAAAASRTAAGHLGERLRPDQPATELGRMATAYDDMLDALETSLESANALKGDRALLAAVIEGSTDAIAVQDLEGTIRTWNTAAQRMLGWSAGDAIGQDVSLVVPHDELGRLSELVAVVVADGGVRTYEGEWLARGGESLPVSVRLSPVRNDEQRIVAVAVGARDVTEQRWMSQTLDSTLAALQTAAEDAKTSEEATRRFLADAAHQLRTPMAGISACAETLLRGAPSEDADRLLATMVRETSRAARLIASLLKMARLDQGLPLLAELVDVSALCQEEVERLSLLSPHLDVLLTSPDGLPITVTADRAACREILSNLGDNARRHARRTITLVVQADGRSATVRVEDDGPGLDGAAREDVFARFVSLDNRGGSGLGLSIGRALATAMSGSLHYESGFVLELPVHQTKADASLIVPTTVA